jgi:hypothetical protein
MCPRDVTRPFDSHTPGGGSHQAPRDKSGLRLRGVTDIRASAPLAQYSAHSHRQVATNFIEYLAPPTKSHSCNMRQLPHPKAGLQDPQ